jgi:2'-deoxynucleoside 5'-phosphate N-hydrolase
MQPPPKPPDTLLNTSRIMTAYIAISYHLRKALDKEVNVIMETLHTFNIIPFVFVDHYQFSPGAEQQMMQQAMTHIGQCDLLIAETSEKGIGIGIEAGYAKAKGKPVIYLRQKNAEHSTTLSGISDFRIIYDDCNELRKELANIIGGMLEKDR